MNGAERIVVAILAAGASTRFGAADKLAMPLAGKPLLHWAAQVGQSVDAARYLLLVPGNGQSHALAGYEQLVNPESAEGLSSSLRLAASAARDAMADALLVLLGDMPLVRPEHLAALMTTHRKEPLHPVFSRAPGGAPQPPAVFPARLFATLEALAGDAGARSLARHAAFVEAPAETLIDVDRPADLALCASLMKGG